MFLKNRATSVLVNPERAILNGKARKKKKFVRTPSSGSFCGCKYQELDRRGTVYGAVFPNWGGLSSLNSDKSGRSKSQWKCSMETGISQSVSTLKQRGSRTRLKAAHPKPGDAKSIATASIDEPLQVQEGLFSLLLQHPPKFHSGIVPIVSIAVPFGDTL